MVKIIKINNLNPDEVIKDSSFSLHYATVSAAYKVVKYYLQKEFYYGSIKLQLEIYNNK